MSQSQPLLEVTNLTREFPAGESTVQILKGIDLKIYPGELVAIVGQSGSGKSTLLKICSGNLKVNEGKIAFNGRDNAWSQQWLKVDSSYMNQFPFIFDGSLRYNVFLDKAAEAQKDYPAFLDKILDKKEEGWETQLSHNGKQLSGGEKQLVTLARMMLYPQPVAILDEPTANLDASTVEIILEQILKMSHERLVIVASHEDKFDAIATTVLQLNWGEQMN